MESPSAQGEPLPLLDTPIILFGAFVVKPCEMTTDASSLGKLAAQTEVFVRKNFTLHISKTKHSAMARGNTPRSVAIFTPRTI